MDGKQLVAEGHEMHDAEVMVACRKAVREGLTAISKAEVMVENAKRDIRKLEKQIEEDPKKAAATIGTGLYHWPILATSGPM